MENLHFSFWVLAGLLSGFLLASLLYSARRNGLLTEISELEKNAALVQQQLGYELDKAKQTRVVQAEQQVKIDSLQNHIVKLTARLRENEVRLQSERQRGEERLQQQQDSETRLLAQFESLSHKIYEEKANSFKSLNKDSLDNLISPLREQIDGFSRQVRESYTNEGKERFSLKVEIERLAGLNQQMTEEAAKLSSALKGDNKQQGNWGEVILQKILEDSGLREGLEYETQVSLKDESGRRFQPDVIVHLPKDKDIVIDSKVSLTAFERYFNAGDEQEKQKALNDHLISLRGHIKGLGRKDYHKLKGVRTLDYVLLFVAVEPAFLLAIEADPSLVKLALEHNILLASPSNLMIALRTIDNLWRYERQEANSRLIAEQASKVYEKLRLFSEDLLDVGVGLDKAQHSYDKAVKKFSQGRGNLIRQAEQFRQLGIEVNKPIPSELISPELD